MAALANALRAFGDLVAASQKAAIALEKASENLREQFEGCDVFVPAKFIRGDADTGKVLVSVNNDTWRFWLEQAELVHGEPAQSSKWLVQVVTTPNGVIPVGAIPSNEGLTVSPRTNCPLWHAHGGIFAAIDEPTEINFAAGTVCIWWENTQLTVPAQRIVGPDGKVGL